MIKIILPVLLLLSGMLFSCGKKIEEARTPAATPIIESQTPSHEIPLAAGINQEGELYQDQYEHQIKDKCFQIPKIIKNVSGVHEESSWLNLDLDGNTSIYCEYEYFNNQFEVIDCFDKNDQSLGVLDYWFVYPEDILSLALKGTQTISERNVQVNILLDTCGSL